VGLLGPCHIHGAQSEWDLPQTSMLAAVQGQGFTAPAAPLHGKSGPFCPHSKWGYLICCIVALGCRKA